MMDDLSFEFSLEDAFKEKEKYIELKIKDFTLYLIQASTLNLPILNRPIEDLGKGIVLPVNEVINNQIALKEYMQKYPNEWKEGYVEDLVKLDYGLEELILSKYLAVKQ